MCEGDLRQAVAGLRRRNTSNSTIRGPGGRKQEEPGDTGDEMKNGHEGRGMVIVALG